MIRTALVLLVPLMALDLLGCRNYGLFEKHVGDASVADAAVAQDGGPGTDGSAQGDGGGVPGDGGGCVLPGLSNLQTNPSKSIDYEQQSPITTTTSPPKSVVLARFAGLSDPSVLALIPGGPSDAALVRRGHITGTLSGGDTVTLTRGGSLVTVVVASDGIAHIIVAYDNGISGVLVEYTWEQDTFSEETYVNLPARPVSLAVGDVNADGVADLFVGLAANSGTANAPAAVRYYVSMTGARVLDNTAVELSLGTIGSPGALSVFPNVAMNRIFLAVLRPGSVFASNGSELRVYMTDAGHTFQPVTLPAMAATATQTMTAADVDLDGQLDLVLGGYGSAAGGTSLIVAFTQLGTQNPGTASISVSGNVFGLQRIDWNQDGADDLFLWEQPDANQMRVYPTILQNRGGGVFKELSSGTISRSSAVVPAIVAPAAFACPPRLVFADTYTNAISVFSP